MVLWRKLKLDQKSLFEIMNRVGMKRRSNVSNTFLVWGGFKDAEPDWECRQAYIIRYNDGALKLSIYGLMGNISASHYSTVTSPRVKKNLHTP